jgi:hypothetical protein
MRHPARILLYVLLTVFPAVFTAVSCSKEPEKGEEAITFVIKNVRETKASLVNDVATMKTKYGSVGFGLLGYHFGGVWNDDLTANFAYNDKCTESDGVWKTSGAYLMPGGRSRLRFFAYAPYNGNGITLPDSDAQGVPVIQYTLPTALASQEDLLVSDTGIIPGDRLEAHPLTFEHPLTTIIFEVASESATGTVKGITISGLYGSGSLPLDAAYWHSEKNPWTPTGERTSYTATMNYSHVSGEGDTSLHENPENDIFLLIPQTLPVPENPGDPCAKMTVSFTMGSSSTPRDYEKSFAGSLPWGRMLKVRIFIKNPLMVEGEDITWETFIADGETLTWIPYTMEDVTAQGSDMTP